MGERKALWDRPALGHLMAQLLQPPRIHSLSVKAAIGFLAFSRRPKIAQSSPRGSDRPLDMLPRRRDNGDPICLRVHRCGI